MPNRNRRLYWTVEWVPPDGKKTLGRLWETQQLSTAYDDHIRRLDTSQPKKKRKPSDRHKDLVASGAFVSARVPVHDATAGKQPNGSTTKASVGKRKREEDEANGNRKAEQEDPDLADPSGSGALQHSASVPASSDANSRTATVPKADFNFYLHHPSLPSRRPVLIPLPPDANLATSLTNRVVLEFPTIYVFHRQPDGSLPEGFVSEEDFFASAKKDMIEEVAGEQSFVGGVGDNFGEREANDLEDGEVNEGRLLEVLGKDLKDIAGSL